MPFKYATLAEAEDAIRLLLARDPPPVIPETYRHLFMRRHDDRPRQEAAAGAIEA